VDKIFARAYFPAAQSDSFEYHLISHGQTEKHYSIPAFAKGQDLVFAENFLRYQLISNNNSGSHLEIEQRVTFGNDVEYLDPLQNEEARILLTLDKQEILGYLLDVDQVLATNFDWTISINPIEFKMLVGDDYIREEKFLGKLMISGQGLKPIYEYRTVDLNSM
jgi:hypothetical protein